MATRLSWSAILAGSGNTNSRTVAHRCQFRLPVCIPLIANERRSCFRRASYCPHGWIGSDRPSRHAPRCRVRDRSSRSGENRAATEESRSRWSVFLPDRDRGGGSSCEPLNSHRGRDGFVSEAKMFEIVSALPFVATPGQCFSPESTARRGRGRQDSRYRAVEPPSPVTRSRRRFAGRVGRARSPGGSTRRSRSFVKAVMP